MILNGGIIKLKTKSSFRVAPFLLFNPFLIFTSTLLEGGSLSIPFGTILSRVEEEK